MAKNNHNINSFIAGEVSKKIFGRTTSQAYNDGCEELTNMIPYNQGGIGRRPGTKFVYRVLGVGPRDVESAFLIPFIATDGTRWQIVLNGLNPLEFVSAPFTLDYTLQHNVVAINMADEQVQQVPPIVPTSTYLQYERFYEQGIFLDSIQYAQDANNNLFIVSKDFPPLVIQYDPNVPTNNFIIASYMSLPNSVYTGAPTQARHVAYRTPSFNINGAPSYVHATTSVNGGTLRESTGASVFTPDWVGRWIKLTDNGVHSGVYIVESIIDPTTVVIRWKSVGTPRPHPSTNTYGGSSITDYYEIGYWDAISGWPRTVSFVDDRLSFGGNIAFPEYQWFSRSLNYFYFDQRGLESDADFSDPLNALDPFEVVYRDGNKPNRINFQAVSKTLVVGTNHYEFIAQAADPNLSINFENFRKNVETPHGSAYAMAVRLENTTIFLNRSRTTLRELVYNFNEDSFNAADLNMLNPDIAKRSISLRPSTEYIHAEEDPGFKQIAAEVQPDQRIWCLDNNGHLCCLTRERKQEINAWSFHKLAGDYLLSNPSEIFYDG